MSERMFQLLRIVHIWVVILFDQEVLLFEANKWPPFLYYLPKDNECPRNNTTPTKIQDEQQDPSANISPIKQIG